MSPAPPLRQLEEILRRHVPAAAVHHCHALWQQYPFSFRLSRSRASKQGDYCHDRRAQTHRISVNADLDPYSFLITYLHEVAHRMAVEDPDYRPSRPHGAVWQRAFRKAMAPVLNAEVFPPEIREVLQRHMRRPRASTQSDLHLALALGRHSGLQSGQVHLASLESGSEFLFRGHRFEKREQRRTRVLCVHLPSRRRYLISAAALVQKVA